MKTEWHWIKNNDFPKDGQRVWCCSAWAGMYCMGEATYLGELGGFYNYISEDGIYKEDNVLCWCELPTLPDELVVGNHCHA